MNINPGCNKGKHSLKIKFREQTKCIDIQIIKLDNFKDIIFSKEIMLKIDVEGFEKEVIQGAVEILNAKQNSIIIAELLNETNGKVICEEIVELLKKNNFLSIYKINNSVLAEKVNNYQGSGDYIFLKGSRTVKFFNKF